MDRYNDLQSSFWDAYTTVLLVRDPWERYLSHLEKWSFLSRFPVFQAAPDNILSDSHEIFGLFPVKILRQNFITQHLVPEFRKHPLNCTDDILHIAKNAVDRFDFVFDFSGLPKESLSILKMKFGVNAADIAKNSSHITGLVWPPPTKEQKIRFSLMNECDYQILVHAHKKIRTMHLELKSSFQGKQNDPKSLQKRI
eukprot:CAMPEP_0185269594 /NCGR_PEP_ID=MMETSP1359-20130426/40256_1 /TAXON_ID=552665 /ORGANISM="Bigelowiella longifila, Strain CCMP242" /LENGTH=196 /DNA_ID=CAMNT_0027860825 /DNA_START=253 /DNA_END=843 /DNA_ORIENTATION=+